VPNSDFVLVSLTNPIARTQLIQRQCSVYIVRSLCCVLGIAYVTFSKASEAALAIETMNGRSIKDNTRQVKVSYILYTP